ncbi:hypothetical protein ACHAXA_003780 [Cyclostephanos tholiformis]|uniref:Uncharacterized protein n=1 Tax=Cyclostephanos tholiformis TaxID=382380 RepID=A0ABD3SSC8_9STRA
MVFLPCRTNNTVDLVSGQSDLIAKKIVHLPEIMSPELKGNVFSAESVVDIDAHPQKNGFHIKLALMVSFIAADAYLNSKAEYDAMELSDGKSSGNAELSQLQMILFGTTIVLQLSIASSLFLILCNTFPFQVGVLFPFQKGIFKWFLILHSAYMLLSCAVGGMRLNQIVVNANTDIFSRWHYSTLSAVHKLAAPCYYAAALQSALALCHEKYYAKDLWVRSLLESSAAKDIGL